MFIFPSQSSGFSWWWWRLFDRVSSILRWCQPPLILIKLFRIFRYCANLIYFEVTNMPFWNPMYLHNEYLNRNKFMVHNPFNWGIFVACLSSFIAQLFIKRTTAVLRRSWKEFPCFLVEISSCADDRRKNIFHSSQLRMAHSNNFQTLNISQIHIQYSPLYANSEYLNPADSGQESFNQLKRKVIWDIWEPEHLLIKITTLRWAI